MVLCNLELQTKDERERCTGMLANIQFVYTHYYVYHTVKMNIIFLLVNDSMLSTCHNILSPPDTSMKLLTFRHRRAMEG